MSYPGRINILVVEDETSVKRYYETVFARLSKTRNIAAPRFAFTLKEARDMVGSEMIFHLIIVDLRIPEGSGPPPEPGELHGLRVVDACKEREQWPVPAVLVFSGQMSGNLEHQLNERLEAEFAYGKARVKPEVETVIENAIDYIERYLAVGIHEIERADEVRVPLTPRERDLLRRAALRNNAIGISLEYRTSDFVRGDLSDGYSGWTKVFVGRFISDDYSFSAINFFKLMPFREASVVGRDALTMQNCLPHIKVRYAHSAGQRYLLVTEKVGARDEPPISLDDLLALNRDQARELVPKAVLQIARQLDRLDVASPDRRTPREILHLATMPNPSRPVSEIALEQVNKHAGLLLESQRNLPFQVLERLLQLDVHFAVKTKKCHGDLNASNVAVDLDEDGIHAYIFDASGMRPSTTEWDLAFLEVTTLLHTSSAEGSLVESCSPLYGQEGPAPGDHLQANTRLFLESIRAAAHERCSAQTYALLVFDITFGQVWGLAFSGSANKVKSGEEAVKLLAIVSRWVQDTIDGLGTSSPILPDEPDF